MKRIIALSSFLFLFLLAALPANITHAAEAKNVDISGITLITDAGPIHATKKGDNFTFNFVGVNGEIGVQKVQFESSTAKTVSVYSQSEDFYNDDLDLQFTNGKAELDVKKYEEWLKRVSEDNANAIAIDSFTGDEFLFTVQDVKDFITDGDGLSGYVADENGNEAEFTVTFDTATWVLKNNKWYYIGPESNSMTDYATGWLLDGDKWYYLDKDGVMKTGWVQTGGKWYYLNANGAMATGWIYKNNVWYYLNATNGDMATNWAFVNGKWYFFNATSGAMKTNWVYTGGKWYFLDASGAMKTGWVSVANMWYYLNNSGAMQTGWVLVNNKWYFLYSDGHMAANTKIGSYRVGKDGAWIR